MNRDGPPAEGPLKLIYVQRHYMQRCVCSSEQSEREMKSVSHGSVGNKDALVYDWLEVALIGFV